MDANIPPILVKQHFFFLKKKKEKTSVENDLNEIKPFPFFSGLRPNLNICKVGGIGLLKNVNVALSGMKIINLTKQVQIFASTDFL